MSKFTLSLNPEQQEAAKHTKGPLLVLAGAGSGKTRVLTQRIARLVKEESVAPEKILAVTFTNKACQEMRHRLSGVLGSAAEQLWISTFHSAGLRILRHYAQKLGYKGGFVVYDSDDTKSVLKRVLEELQLDSKQFPPEVYSREIDSLKNNLIPSHEFAEKNQFHYKIRLSEVYQNYQRALMRANAMDFGDLLLNPVLLLQQYDHIRESYQHGLEYILVDEFQDTNIAQYKFISILAAKHGNLFVVGDDDQSIYRFRGATVRNILEFEKNYPDTKVIKLEQNYRSTVTILDVANAVIAPNPDRKPKKLWTAGEEGEPVVVLAAQDDDEEARFVVDAILGYASGGMSLNDIVILYRTNAQSRAFEEQLVRARLPYRIFGGLKFYDRKEIKDIIGYLRLLINEADDQALFRVINTPPRGIGVRTEEELKIAAISANRSIFETLAHNIQAQGKNVIGFYQLIRSLQEKMQQLSLPELILAIANDTGYLARLKSGGEEGQSRIENIEELIGIAAAATDPEKTTEENLREFLDRASLTAGSDEADGSGENEIRGSVSLMTLHLAKGLEFPVVFLVGFEEGLLPHSRSIDSPEELSEERRLAYVGITRARKQLYLTRAEIRSRFSGFRNPTGVFRQPSRFSADLPRERLNDIGGDFFKKRSWDDSLEVDPEFLEHEHQEVD